MSELGRPSPSCLFDSLLLEGGEDIDAVHALIVRPAKHVHL